MSCSAERVNNDSIHKVEGYNNAKKIKPDALLPRAQIDDVEFMLMDVMYTYERTSLYVDMYGVTIDGSSIMVRTEGFLPHFSINAPEKGRWTQDDITGFIEALERALVERLNVKYKQKSIHMKEEKEEREAQHFRKKLINRVESFEGFPLIGCHPEPLNFLKIFVAYPSLVKECRLLLEYPHGTSKPTLNVADWWPIQLIPPCSNPFQNSDMNNGYPEYFRVFEANLEFTIRFEVDHSIKPCEWVLVKKGCYKVSSNSYSERISTSQIELYCHHSVIGPSSIPSTQIPSFCIYSYDIECLPGPSGEFPSAQEQPVTHIGYKKVFGDCSMIRGVHCVGSCENVKDADEVFCYEDEPSMLRGFLCDVRNTDPDFMVGYNQRNFDNPYIIDRLAKLDIKETCGSLGRKIKEKLSYRASSFSSSAHKTETKTTVMTGRLQIDMLESMKREKKLRSYRLEAVSQTFLGKGKVEVDINKMRDLNQTPKGRGIISYYCMIDAELPFDLMVQQKCLMTYLQMSSAAGVSIQQFLDRGQQLRILSLVYHYSRTLKIPFVIPVIPSYRRFPDDKYQGAVVINGAKGLLVGAVSTLDFSSLCMY